ncbi:hypothetical protein PSTT_11791 [Puccinia striiformis]|uniref:ornithine decarboxylase n=1 Tax=Puccinia striiformis TaxID=27350 RepID=A0A2S4UYT0_9BASI|nr:hypothetical protein PSTT_11791 [Puccinia striiformis]
MSGFPPRSSERHLTEIDTNKCEENGENAFYVCDLAYVYRQYLRWKHALGDRVEPFFAVKCNPDKLVLKLLAKLGTGFDCASHAEIEMILKLGVQSDRIIYANPCKAGSFIRHAAQKNVEMMTFDNQEELDKVAKFHPNAKMVLRILTDDSGSLCRLGEKFGAPLENVKNLLERAKELGVNVIGVAFHVGSGCSNPDLYIDAVSRAKWTFEIAQELGFEFNFLDVGGGFGDENFDLLVDGLITGLDKYFPVGCGVRVIAEPGRYFVTRAFELATNIIARRKAPLVLPKSDDLIQQETPLTMYYINDGVYGAFNCIIFDHQVVEPKVLTLGGVFYGEGLRKQDTRRTYDAIIIRERDGLFNRFDLYKCRLLLFELSSNSLLPVRRLVIGDWLRWPNMGAYTICAASQFNGFLISKVVYTIGDSGLDSILREILA